MRVVRGLDQQQMGETRSVLSIGNFDGVHRGHQAIIAQTTQRAQREQTPAVVLTFEPHPISILRPNQSPPRLQSLERKLDTLDRLGIDLVVVAESTPELLANPADDFLNQVIVSRFRPLHIVEGDNFRFGRDRAGDVLALAAAGLRHGFEVHVVEPVEQKTAGGGKARVSSSMIRQLIGVGEVQEAADALGRAHVIEGVVVEGAKRGRTIGFPTANIQPVNMVPAEGVYAGSTEVNGSDYRCAVSIGRTPTFGETDQQVEAHLIDFDGDLYGKSLSIGLLHRIRKQEKFASVDALVSQIQRDVETIRAGMTQSPAR